jgi:exodeoxyribonuclease-3
MKLISWNVNGIRAVWKKDFLQWLLQENPDVLCLQETKASVDQLSPEMTDVGQYKSFWCSAEKKGYSGVAIYTKKEPLSVTKGIGLAEFDSEGRVLVADFGSFVLFNVYFPNGGTLSRGSWLSV